MSMEPFDESGSNPACFMLAQDKTSLLFFFDDETISYLNDKRTKLSMKLFMNRDIFLELCHSEYGRRERSHYFIL